MQTEERLRTRMIDYRFEPNLRLDEIILAEGSQVRLIEHRAPAAMVSRYAEQMRAGAVFPAIVVNDRNEVIDGNTRRLASAKAGRTSIAAYICTGLTSLEARSLSVELNQCHGLSMTEDELKAFVLGAFAAGETVDAKAYARMTGVRSATLSRWVSQASFAKRASASGIPESHCHALSESAQAILNGVRLTPVLVELTALAVAAKVTASDLRKLVGQVNAAASEREALGIVLDERENRRDDIRALATGFAAKRKQHRRASMHVGALLKLEPAALQDLVSGEDAAWSGRLRTLRDRIDDVLRSVPEVGQVDDGRLTRSELVATGG